MSEEAIAHVADETNEVWLSVASVWEMGIKVAIEKLPLPESIDSYISSRMMQLGARSLFNFSNYRMLIAQAQLENLTLVSADARFRQYNDFSILWAANS